MFEEDYELDIKKKEVERNFDLKFAGKGGTPGSVTGATRWATSPPIASVRTPGTRRGNEEVDKVFEFGGRFYKL